MITKLKSKLLTYLFKDWVKNEYDLETLELTKGMIDNRAIMLKTIIDKVNHKPIKLHGVRLQIFNSIKVSKTMS